MYLFSSGSLACQDFNSDSAERLKCKLVWKDINVISEVKSDVANKTTLH